MKETYACCTLETPIGVYMSEADAIDAKDRLNNSRQKKNDFSYGEWHHEYTVIPVRLHGMT